MADVTSTARWTCFAWRNMSCSSDGMPTVQAPSVDFWRELIQAEYCEMPGLHLTKPQVQRLWGLDDTTVEVVLAALEDEKFLRRTSDDTYARVGIDV
jgi:hypothetical protein